MELAGFVTALAVPVNRKETQSSKWSGLPTDDTVPMCIADMDFLAPVPVLSAIVQRAAHGVYGYTGSPDSLCETMVSWVARRYQWAIDPAWLLLNQGVVTSLCMAIRALTAEGEGVIIQPPVYHPFFSVIRQNHRQVIENPLVLDHGTYHMDLDLLAQQARNARLLILCNPHNPIGRVWTNEELTQLGRICLDHGVTVISDDIHADFTWTSPYCPFAALHPDFAQNSITCLSPSKTFNIAGLQTSYEIIPNPVLRRKIRQEKSGCGISEPNLFGLLALEKAYRECDGWLDDLLHYLQTSQTLVREWATTQEGISLIEPEGTYLAWLDCRALGYTSKVLAEYFLQHARVRLHAGSIYGIPGEGFLRMNYATNHATLATALACLTDAVPLLGSDHPPV